MRPEVRPPLRSLPASTAQPQALALQQDSQQAFFEDLLERFVPVRLVQTNAPAAMEITVLKWKSSVAKMRGEAFVDGQLVAEAVVMCKLADKPEPPAQS